jgi:hypothetical protein
MSVKKNMKVTGAVPPAKNVAKGMASGGRFLVKMVREAKVNEGKSMAMSGARRGDLRRGGRMSLKRGEMIIAKRGEMIITKRGEMIVAKRGERTHMKNVGKTMRRGRRIMQSEGKRGLMMTTEGSNAACLGERIT